MARDEIIKKAEAFVRELYATHASDMLVYHNLAHTEKVVKAAVQIADYYQLEDQDYVAVLVAAWFHDAGYLFGCTVDHEEKSAELAATFLKQENESRKLIEKVGESILATKIFCSPPSLIAKILADADLFHLGTPDFKKTNKMMWVEMKRCFGEKIPADKWYQGALKLLERHQFHTEYCRELLQEGKQENIRLLRMQLEEYTRNRSIN